MVRCRSTHAYIKSEREIELARESGGELSRAVNRAAVRAHKRITQLRDPLHSLSLSLAYIQTFAGSLPAFHGAHAPISAFRRVGLRRTGAAR